MLFTFVLAATSYQALSLRPAFSVKSNFAKLHDLAAAARLHPSTSVTVLQQVANIVNSIMLQEGNATEHMSEDDKALLHSVIDLIDTTIYGSMDSSHDRDEATLAAAIAAINACYGDFTARVTTGDLYHLRGNAASYQNTLDGLKADVDAKTLVNDTTWNNLFTHIVWISDPPACHDLPDPRIMATLDIFFSASPYVNWYTAQKAAYEPLRDAFVIARAELELALTQYAVGLATRDVAYCDFKRELEAGCAQFSACYDLKVHEYLNVIKPEVENDVEQRINAYKAGETIVHQIKFLLAEIADQSTPAIATDRYQIDYPAVPAKPECDLSVLDDPMWAPTPSCVGMRDLLDGCSTSGNVFSAWGSPREERDDQRAGEAICCNDAGTCTRRISNSAGEFSGFSHDHCITPDGGRLDDGVDTPSWTWSEAKAHCEAAGLRLPHNQEEMDTSCGTGCHKDFTLAWTDSE